MGANTVVSLSQTSPCCSCNVSLAPIAREPEVSMIPQRRHLPFDDFSPSVSREGNPRFDMEITQTNNGFAKSMTSGERKMFTSTETLKRKRRAVTKRNFNKELVAKSNGPLRKSSDSFSKATFWSDEIVSQEENNFKKIY